MNLNAYIGLVGGHYRIEQHGDGQRLVACSRRDAELAVREAEFLLTLDADSLIHRDYAAKLVRAMTCDARMAVAQTPYSAFPGTLGALERSAGATTDLQFIAHQGSSAFNAGYWVGANALLR